MPSIRLYHRIREDFLIDTNIQKFLENSFAEVIDYAARKLQTHETAGVVTYKQRLMDLTKQNDVFDRTNSLANKLSKDMLTQADMKKINDLDELLIKSMLVSERKIKKR